MSTQEKGKRGATRKVVEIKHQSQVGEVTYLRGEAGTLNNGKRVYVEFSTECHFLGRVWVEGEEDKASRIDFGKQVFLDGPVAGITPHQVIEAASEMMENWERRQQLAEANPEELLRVLWNSLHRRT